MKKIKLLVDISEEIKKGQIITVSDKAAHHSVTQKTAEYVVEHDLKPKKVKATQSKPPKSHKPQDTVPQYTKSTKIESIVDLFEHAKQTSSGNYKTECPSCELQGGRTEGLILFPETNTWFCHSTQKHGGVLEILAIQEKIIDCADCNEKGEKGFVLDTEQYKEVLERIKEHKRANDLTILAGGKVSLQWNDTLTSILADTIGDVVGSRNLLFYRPELNIVCEVVKIKTSDGFEFRGLRDVSATRFVTLIEKFFNPYVIKKGFESKSISKEVASTIMQSDAFIYKIPTIKRIFNVPAPTIYQGKLTLPKRGYDPRLNSWLQHDAPQIVTSMSLKEAKDTIAFVFQEFAFEEEYDRTVAISALITPYLRGLYGSFNERTPLFAYMANRERAGKDYCRGVVSMTHEGDATEETPISTGESGGNNNEELRKKITGAFIYGRKSLHFANNKGRINNSVLEAVITSRKYRDRVLGKSQIVEFDNELEFSLSGNTGMTFTPDLLNRARLIRLFLAIENANEREFTTPDLHGWILENRETVLSAVYALVRNWFENDCPAGSKPFASFPEWARVCGGVMESAGYDSPCKLGENAPLLSLDTDTEDMKTLFELCFKKYGGIAIKAGDVREMASENNLFSYLDLTERSGQTKFSLTFQKFVGRILSDIELTCKDSKKRSARQEFVFQKSAKSGNVGNLGNVSPQVIPRARMRVMEKLPKKVTSVTNVTKSDRELQYWEDPICDNIKATCTEKEVFDYLTKHPEHVEQPKILLDKFGSGVLKFKISWKQARAKS